MAAVAAGGRGFRSEGGHHGLLAGCPLRSLRGFPSCQPLLIAPHGRTMEIRQCGEVMSN